MEVAMGKGSLKATYRVHVFEAPPYRKTYRFANSRSLANNVLSRDKPPKL